MRALQAATRAAAGLRPRGPLRGPSPAYPRSAAGASPRQLVHRSTLLDEVFAAPTEADAAAADAVADVPPSSAPATEPVAQQPEQPQPEVFPADDDAKRFQLVRVGWSFLTARWQRVASWRLRDVPLPQG